MTRLDVLIIGAGQAGLALGYHLQKTPLCFQLVERYERLGDSWRERYDSLVLFTPRAYSALPGLALAGVQDGYPGKDEFADYLANYARHFDLLIITGTSIQSLERHNRGYRATTQDGAVIEVRAVVLATGSRNAADLYFLQGGTTMHADIRDVGDSHVPTGRHTIRAAVLWGLLFGGIQVASPLLVWWLAPGTVYAISLILIASVYIGFAVADGRPIVIAVESSIAAIFVMVAAAAITGPAWLLVIGLAGHALKDLWQHRRQYVAGTRWWAPFCCTVDLVAAALIGLALLGGML